MTKALIWILPIIIVISGCAEIDSSGGGGIISVPKGVLAIVWVAPTKREDGTPLILSEIETYNVYYGNSPGDYQYKIDNSEVTTDSIHIPAFPGGTYYFVITTVTTDGLESRYSNEVTVQI